MPLKPGTEEYWQAESDARALVHAQEIKSDSSRLTNANEILQAERQATIKAAAEAKKALNKTIRGSM